MSCTHSLGVLTVLGWVLFEVSACSSEPPRLVGCTPGTIGCSCTSGNQCGIGLTCVTGTCIELGATTGGSSGTGGGVTASGANSSGGNAMGGISSQGTGGADATGGAVQATGGAAGNGFATGGAGTGGGELTGGTGDGGSATAGAPATGGSEEGGSTSAGAPGTGGAPDNAGGSGPEESNIISNGDFSQDTTGWKLEGGGTMTVTDGALCVTLDSADEVLVGWPPEASEAALLDGGTSYTLSYRAKSSSSDISVAIKVGHAADPWTTLLEESDSVESSWTALSHTFTPESTDDAAGVVFKMSGATGEVCFDDVVLQPAH